MSAIQIFVYFGMSGKRSATISDITTKTTVEEFMKKIADKEGAEGVRILFGGKQLEPKRNGRVMTLEDYGLYNEATCHASLRLHGGAQMPAEGVQARKFNDDEVKKFGGEIVSTDCIFGISDGCYESNIKKCKLKCGCIYCADCMKHYINTQITVGLNVIIYCGDTSHGNTELDSRLAYAVAALSISEKKNNDKILSENSFKRPDAVMSICPNGKCEEYVWREGSAKKQQCERCKKNMCWDCKKEHKGTQQGCGNNGCDPIAYITLLLGGAKLKTISDGYGNIEITDTRLCPKCYEVNIHDVACRHMTCKGCTAQYCHVCLQMWDGHSSPCTVAAGEQKITKEMLAQK